MVLLLLFFAFSAELLFFRGLGGIVVQQRYFQLGLKYVRLQNAYLFIFMLYFLFHVLGACLLKCKEQCVCVRARVFTSICV